MTSKVSFLTSIISLYRSLEIFTHGECCTKRKHLNSLLEKDVPNTFTDQISEHSPRNGFLSLRQSCRLFPSLPFYDALRKQHPKHRPIWGDKNKHAHPIVRIPSNSFPSAVGEGKHLKLMSCESVSLPSSWPIEAHGALVFRHA